MSRVERYDGPRDNTPHDEANCPSCQADIAAMTTTPPSAGPAEPRRDSYGTELAPISESDGRLYAGPAEVRRHYVESGTLRDKVLASRPPHFTEVEVVIASDYDTLSAQCAAQARELAERDARIARLRDMLCDAVELLCLCKAVNGSVDADKAAFLERLAKEPT